MAGKLKPLEVARLVAPGKYADQCPYDLLLVTSHRVEAVAERTTAAAFFVLTVQRALNEWRKCFTISKSVPSS
jgi:hypothetical protein